jgi:hypothetical protein
MDRFVNDRNLGKYRKLARATTTKAEREMLFASLAEENVECFGPRNARQDEQWISQQRSDQSGLQSRIAKGCADGGGVTLQPGIGEGAIPEPSTRTPAFELHDLQAMLGAFDAVCAQLHLPTHEGSRPRKRVASMIFDLAMTGETDEKRLVAKVLAEFRLEKEHVSASRREPIAVRINR